MTCHIAIRKQRSNELTKPVLSFQCHGPGIINYRARAIPVIKLSILKLPLFIVLFVKLSELFPCLRAFAGALAQAGGVSTLTALLQGSGNSGQSKLDEACRRRRFDHHPA